PRAARPDRARHEPATAVRADVLEDVVHAPGAERALVAADPCLLGVGREIRVAPLAVRSQGEHRSPPGVRVPRSRLASAGPSGFGYDGGAKNSSAMPSGSRKLTPEPYAASLMRPRRMPSSSSRRAHFSSSSRSAHPNATWS